MFQSGRFISGLGIGILVTVCPMYLSEMSSPFRRGWLVGHHAIFLVFGYMFSAWIGYGCYFATSINASFAWRFPLCFQALCPFVLLVGSPWLPRSPRWLVSKNKNEEAFNVILKLRVSAKDPDHLVAKEEFYQIKEQWRLDSSKMNALGQNIWIAAWMKKSYRKRMVIGFLTQWYGYRDFLWIIIDLL